MRLWQWLRARVQPRRPPVLPPEPFDAVGERLDVAIECTRSETRRLAIDGSELAERIKRNARAGRNALEGKS